MSSPDRAAMLRFRIRGLLIGFIIGLALSGITAFPLPQELAMLLRWMGIAPDANLASYSGLSHWILKVDQGLQATYLAYPFLFYGYDWLAFAHLVIAVLFVGPLKDPVRNVWVIQWGMIACALVLPLAFICGTIRGIPMAWRLIDCSFGVVGIVPLYFCYRYVRELEKATESLHG